MNGFSGRWAWGGISAVVLSVVLSSGVPVWAENGDRPRNEQDRRQVDEARGENDDSSQQRDEGERRTHRASSREMDEGAIRQLLSDIDLNDKQQSKIREALAEARNHRVQWWREHGSEVRALRQAVREARQADDREAFREHWTKLGELMFDAPERSAVVDDVRAVLTDEQWEKLQTNWEKMQEERGRWGGRGDRSEE